MPVDKFNLMHLPHFYQDNDLLAYIRCLSDLTVRVVVRYVSEKRPKIWTGCDSLKDKIVTGTGYIIKVDRGDVKHGSCLCKECHESPLPTREFAYIDVCTVPKVVCDESELEHSTCDIFFDRNSSSKTGSGVITLNEKSDSKSVIDKHTSKIVFVAHDMSLINRLEELLRKRQSLEQTLVPRYCPPPHHFQEKKRISSAEPEQPLAIIVSHPHGCSKQISVGICTGKYPGSKYGSSRLTYTAATCPGCAGAQVLVVGLRRWNTNHVHAGQCEVNKGLGHSELGTDRPNLFYSFHKVSSFQPFPRKLARV